MGQNWKDVKAKIERDLDRIMWEEPLEVKMSRLGVFPSGSGTHEGNLSNLLYQVADTQAMSWWTVEPAMLQALDDPDLDVEAAPVEPPQQGATRGVPSIRRNGGC